ncbi:MAG: hypothetical protein GF417_01485 [Candidatus Latescibacteria bacterium]|nr:hypothetical protein [Candidatus Latescibacterota bacterium]
MQNPVIISMSSKGRMVNPEKIRNQFDLRAGIRFIVMIAGDTIILKPIKGNSLKEFETLHKKLLLQIEEAGLKSGDIRKTIKEVRGDNGTADKKDNE